MVESNRKLIEILKNVGIAIAGFSLTVGVCHRLNISNSISYGWINFCFILSIYSLQRIADKSNFHLKDLFINFAVNTDYQLLFFFFCCGTISFFCTVNFIFPIIILSALFLLIALGYTMPIFGKKLREIPYLKDWVIAGTWTFAIVLFPLLNEGLYQSEWIPFLLIFTLYIFALVIPFDVRDLYIDFRYQKTLPQLVGPSNASLIAIFLILIYFAVHFLVPFEQNNFFLIALALGLMLQIILIYRIGFMNKEKQVPLLDWSIAIVGLSYLF